MKGFLLFCALLSGVLFLGLALPYLDDRDQDYEQRLVGALNFTEDALETVLGVSAEIYEPTIAPGSTRGHWILSGTVVPRKELNSRTGVPFVANLRSLCSDPAAAACWQTVELAIEGRAVRPEAVAAAPDDTAAEAIGEEARGAGDPSEQPVIQAAVQLAEEAAAVPLLPADEALPAQAESPIEAAVSAEQAPTPGVSADDPASGQDLVLFVQDALKKLRYEPGPVDGKLGVRTTAAIRAYQRDFDLPQDGRPTPGLLRHMRRQLSDQGQQSLSPAAHEASVAG